MARLPHIKPPMAATQLPRPFHRPGWIYEEKIDGWRVLAYKGAAGVRLMSRNGRDLTRRFTDLAAAVAGLKPATLILDGEIAVFDRHLLSRFEWLRRQPKDEPATPPTLSTCAVVVQQTKPLLRTIHAVCPRPGTRLIGASRASRRAPRRVHPIRGPLLPADH